MTIAYVGESIEFDVNGEAVGAYLARPAAAGRIPAVIIAHQLFGVTEDIRAFTDRLAGLGYLAIAPDFYHRSEPGLALPVNDEGRTRGLALLAELTRGGVLSDIAAVQDYLGKRDDFSGAIGMLGVSMGGHIAYLAATQFELPITLSLYAGWLVGSEIPLSRPAPTLELTGGIAGRLLYIVGDEDQIIGVDQRTAIAKKLAAEDIDHDFIVIPGAPHAFLSEDTPSFQPEAAAQTWAIIERELATALSV